MKPLSATIKSKLLPLSLIFCLMTGMLCSCRQTQTITFEEFTEELFQNEISSNTLNLHYALSNPKAYGITDYEITLGDFSKESRSSSKEDLEELKDSLLQFQTGNFRDNLEDRLTYELLTDYIDTQIALCDYELYYEPLSFSGGLQMELPILFAEYELSDEEDIEEYLTLLSLLDTYLEQVMEFETEKAETGLFMSDTLCQKVIDSCEAFLEEKEEHYLVSTFTNRLSKLGLSEKKMTSYEEQNKEILESQVYPAYEHMITVLKNLMGSGVNTGGICNFENGKDYYQLLVYSETGCDDSVDELYERIENQRVKDLLSCSNIYQKNPSIVTESSYLDWEFETPDGALSTLQDKILDDFPQPPETTYEINYVDSALEEYLAPAFYIVSPIDNYENNVIYINERYVSSDVYAFTTLAHEGYPGHLYQTVMTYSYEYPDVRNILNYAGYSEGWATYVEMMSYFYADIDEDIASFLSHNQSATLSLYASSDIGLHYYGWTKEDMYEFWSGYGISDESVIEEITRLILSEPGNYLKYYVGYIEFLSLKEYAKETLQDAYSDLEFHRAILDIGPAPFPIIEKYLTEFYSPQT